MSTNDPWGDRGPGKNDPPFGHQEVITFTTDDIIGAALEAEFIRRGWSKKYTVLRMAPILGQDNALTGFQILVERTEK